ncbi:prolipoprotein diacylglyceryl transferase [Paenibacillus endoradicis]|uniref:prolipoprotein diacylglyceryl transferase n=1 Tax=Paenibacillus endoradicis TaxID=2972487 RepID=UPI00215969FD|nr:prolipoprotein diacylglyceryl transferase [Paenibacillus endoradicis]MCR8659709.1 prolipoprotein diacylglyceryl transferase [Paenibacillus endoradicis]
MSLELVLNPIMLEIGPLIIRWYGVILALGAVAGLLLAIQEGKRFGIKSEFFMDLLLIGAPTAIIAARIYYVAFQWDHYKNNLGDIVKIWEGGIAIYGAIAGALICGYFFSKAKGYSFWRIADICAPGLLIGQMIGRWGNFVNQEAYGGPVEESFLRDTLHIPNFIVEQMYIIKDSTFVHPTFLYESLWSLLGLILLFVIRRRSFLREGELIATYIGWYSIGRFFIEALRTDSLGFVGPTWLANLINGLWTPMEVVFQQGYMSPAYGNIRSSQLVALLLVLGAIIFVIVRRINIKTITYYNDPLISSKAVTAIGVDQVADSHAKKSLKNKADSASTIVDSKPDSTKKTDNQGSDSKAEQHTDEGGHADSSGGDSGGGE